MSPVGRGGSTSGAGGGAGGGTPKWLSPKGSELIPTGTGIGACAGGSRGGIVLNKAGCDGDADEAAGANGLAAKGFAPLTAANGGGGSATDDDDTRLGKAAGATAEYVPGAGAGADGTEG